MEERGRKKEEIEQMREERIEGRLEGGKLDEGGKRKKEGRKTEEIRNRWKGEGRKAGKISEGRGRKNGRRLRR